jgi:hypothetical protein
MFNRELFLETQTSRCLLCENAPCSHACTHIFRSATSYAPSGLKIIWELPKKSEMFHAWIAAIRCA